MLTKLRRFALRVAVFGGAGCGHSGGGAGHPGIQLFLHGAARHVGCRNAPWLVFVGCWAAVRDRDHGRRREDGVCASRRPLRR